MYNILEVSYNNIKQNIGRVKIVKHKIKTWKL